MKNKGMRNKMQWLAMCAMVLLLGLATACAGMGSGGAGTSSAAQSGGSSTGSSSSSSAANTTEGGSRETTEERSSEGTGGDLESKSRDYLDEHGSTGDDRTNDDGIVNPSTGVFEEIVTDIGEDLSEAGSELENRSR